jgi:hypothetical protein
MNIKDLKVGQEVWAKRYGNEAKGYSQNELISKHIITKVGHKYFKISNYEYYKCEPDKKYNYANIYYKNYGLSINIYLSLNDIEIQEKEERERNELNQKFDSIFRYSSLLTLDQLRRINTIIEEKKGNK